jgi:hypothetical protein
MRLVGLPKPFYYCSKHKLVGLSAAADQKMQKLKLWEVLKQKGIKEDTVLRWLREAAHHSDQVHAVLWKNSDITHSCKISCNLKT